VTVRPLAVFVGFIGKRPVAGMTLYNLHYLLGLQELGYDVHYVEQQNDAWDCYDPVTTEVTNDPTFALGYLADVMPRLAGIGKERYSFLDLEGRCHGSGREALLDALDTADFVLTVADPTWFDELERCPRRAFVDGDPLFTQVEMIEGGNPKAEAIEHYDTLFTYGARMGEADCSVPPAGRRWLPTRPVVATRWWPVAPPNPGGALTTVMHWGAWNDYTYDGQVYGHKNREVERFLELPQRSTDAFLLAIGGDTAPVGRLKDLGWRIEDAGEVTRTIDSYREFIASSRADLGIAKHAYVASRGGWFSDRSTCYLAAGRPVLHQETGFSDWLPAGEGVLAFSDVDDVLDALSELDRRYEAHARAARAIAEEYFEAATVVGRMLDEAGFR
jgi:hypothetical protein